MRRLLLAALAGATLLAGHTLQAQDAASGGSFQIDSRASNLRIIVYRKGLLSMFSHDHVLVAEGIAGLIRFQGEDLAEFSFQLSVPVESLVVDPQAAREEEGFSEGPDEDDRAAIRETLLDEPYLDGANYPRVVVTADRITGELPLLHISMNIRIKQTERKIVVPTHVTVENDTLRASGEISFLQSDFAVEPFSSLLGTLAVEDEVLVRFDIVARRQP